jgi:hypothetical protein
MITLGTVPHWRQVSEILRGSDISGLGGGGGVAHMYAPGPFYEVFTKMLIANIVMFHEHPWTANIPLSELA